MYLKNPVATFSKRIKNVVKNTFFFTLLQSISFSAYCLSSDGNEPLQINADKTEINYFTGVTVYSGNVIATQGTTCLQADKVITYSDDKQQIQKIIAEGDRAIYKTLPKPEQKPLIAKAKTIDYYPEKADVILSGDGEVVQGTNIFRGPKIYYNIKSQLVISTPVKNERTHVIVQPKSFNKK